MTACVLFVDDEPNILQGLRRMLRNMREEWDMLFAGSGTEALELMGRTAIDVLVTDMRMPGIDGGQLLAEVERRHPQVTRIILSGQCNRDAAMRLIGASHQFLTKPCDSTILIRSVKRALALRRLLADEALRSLASSVRLLPSPPAVYHELISELSSPQSSLRSVSQIIARDVGLSAKILQLANSAYFGISWKVSTPAQAVNLLGLETISALILSCGISAQLESSGLQDQVLERMLEHSLACGSIARAIAKAEHLDPRDAGSAFAAGLLHDVGALVLAANLPAKYAEVTAVLDRDSWTRLAVEKETFGTTHAAVGAYLVGLWGLPDSIVEAIAYHHTPLECDGHAVDVLTAVHAANGLAQALSSARQVDELAGFVEMSHLSKLGVAHRLPLWAELAAQAIRDPKRP